MATLGLGIAGFAIAGPPGAIVGGTIGALIDASVIAAITPPTKIGKLDDTRLGSADEGKPAAWISGPRCRVSGQVIWMSPLREIQHSSGGNLLEGPRVVNYYYYGDIAIAFARRECVGISRLWVGSQLIYSAVPGATVISTGITFVKDTTLTAGNVAEFVELTHPGPNNNLTVFVPGGTVTVSGAANAVNNGTFEVLYVQTDIGSPGISRMRLLKCVYPLINPPPGSVCSPSVNASPGPTITIVQNPIPLLPGYMDSMTFYPGSASQSADPTMQAALGSTNTPAYRGTCYVLLKNVNLTKFAGTLPQVDAEIAQTTLASSKSVGTLLTELCTLSGGLTSADIDVTALSGVNFSGLTVTGFFSPMELVKATLFAASLDVQQRGSKLHFFKRQDAAVITVEDQHRGAREAGSDAPKLLQLEPISPTKIPKEVNITAFSTDRDLQPGSRSARAVANPLDNKMEVTLPFTMVDNMISIIAKRTLAMARSAQLLARLQLPINYIHVIEGDILRVHDSDDLLINVRINNIDRGALNGLLLAEAPTYDIENLTQSAI